MSIPGLYQIVFLSHYGQLVRSVSSIYVISNPNLMSKTIITMDTKRVILYPGQSFNVSIAKDIGTPYNTLCTIAFVRRYNNNSTTNDYNLTIATILNSPSTSNDIFRSRYTFYWDSNSTTMNITIPFNYIQYGFYKFYMYIGTTTIQRYYNTSSPNYIYVRRPIVKISLPKRIYKLLETVSFNPITDLYDPYGAYQATTRNYPLRVSIISINTSEVVSGSEFSQPFHSGLYRLAILSDHMFNYQGLPNRNQYKRLFIQPIRNTTVQTIEY